MEKNIANSLYFFSRLEATYIEVRAQQIVGAVSHFVRRKTEDKLDDAVCTSHPHVSNIFET